MRPLPRNLPNVATMSTKPSQLRDLLRKTAAELLPLYRGLPGFVAFTAAKTVDATAVCFAIWHTREEAEQAVKTSDRWMKEGSGTLIDSLHNSVCALPVAIRILADHQVSGILGSESRDHSFSDRMELPTPRRTDTQAIACGGVTMISPERSAFDGCLLRSFQDVLRHYDLEFETHRIGRVSDLVPTNVKAHVWELILHCGSHVYYSAWAALVPGATPDLLDVISPSALESPGPVPRYVVEVSAASSAFQRRLLRHWAHAIQAHDELQGLVASMTPDTAVAMQLFKDLRAASVRCDWARLPPDAPAGYSPMPA